MKGKIFEKLSKFVLKNYKIILISGIILSIISVLLLVRLKLNTDYASMMADYLPSVQNIHKMTEEMGGLGYYYVVLYFGEKDIVDKLQEFRNKKEEIEKEYISLKNEYEKLKDNLEEAKDEVKNKQRRLKYIEKGTERYNRQSKLLEEKKENKQNAQKLYDEFVNQYGTPEEKGTPLYKTKLEYETAKANYQEVNEKADKRLEKAISFTEALINEFQKLDSIRYIDYKNEFDFIKKHILLYIDTEDLEKLNSQLYGEMASSTGLFIDFQDEEDKITIDGLIEKYSERLQESETGHSEYYVDKDKKMLAIYLKPTFNSTDTGLSKNLEKNILSIINKIGPDNYIKDMKIKFSGGYKLKLDERNAIETDLLRASILAFILIIGCLWLFFRKFSYMLNLIIALSMGCIWTFGFTFIMFQEITVITSFLAAILLGLGVDFGVHFTARYTEEHEKGASKTDAIKVAFKEAGVPSFIGMITTAGAFLTLVFSNFKAFFEFGLIAGTGIMFTFIAMHTILIGLLIMFVKEKEGRKATPINVLHKKLEKASDKGRFKYPIPILITAGILTIVFGYFALTKARFSYDTKALQVKNQESIKVDEDVQDNFDISPDPAVFISEDLDDAKILYDYFNPETEAKKEKLEERFPDTGQFISIYDVYPPKEKRKRNLELINKLKDKLEKIGTSGMTEEEKEEFDYIMELVSIDDIKLSDLPKIIRYKFLGIGLSEIEKENTYFSFLFPSHTLWDGKEIIKFAEQVREVEIPTEDGSKIYNATGNHILFADMMLLVLNEGKIFFFIVLGVVFLFLILDFRSLKGAVLAILPLIVGVIWMLGIMGILDVPVNFMNFCVVPIILGMGVDHGIHIYHRYKTSGSAFTALKRAGGAVVISAVTTMFGWGALEIAMYRGVTTMAHIALIGLGACLVTSITILPATLQLIDDVKEKRRKKKEEIQKGE